jgi:palmitoyltransferase ZDHHC2/15/20
VQIAFFVVITMFFKFHVELVLSNSSTLDNLERQRNPNVGPNIYDVGPYENFTQVFGTNAVLWPFPVAGSSSQKANGVVWPKNTN